jgi:hypothetical protein
VRAAAATAERSEIRSAVGGAMGVGLNGLVPAALAGEAGALVAEWRAHQAGWSAAESRRAGDAAGLATTAAVAVAWAAAAGPGAAVAGGLAATVAWAAGRPTRRRPA